MALRAKDDGPAAEGIIADALPDDWSIKGTNDDCGLLVVGYDGDRDAIDLQPLIGVMDVLGYKPGYLVRDKPTIQFRREA